MKPGLGIFLNFGDSFLEYKKAGRDSHWLNNYLKFYPKVFHPVYVFSYANESNPYPRLIKLLPNRHNLPRWLYVWLIPFVYAKEIKQCSVLRVKQMLGVWPAMIAKLLWQKPIVATYGYDYAYFAQKEGKWWLVPWIKLTEWLGWQMSDVVIVTTPSSKPKARLISNGVDTDLFKPAVRRARRVKILNIGRLVNQKNQLVLIKAIAKLKQSAELIIVGRGTLKNKILNLAKKLKVKLNYIESLPHQELASLYQQADIFCLPSHHEGSPKALLEAMSCGLPCVVTDKPYSQFIIKNGQDGLLVNNSISQLSKSINQLIESWELRQKIGKSARQTILNRFDNQKIIYKEIRLLNSFLPFSSV